MVIQRADAWQRRRPWASFPVAVVYKFVDDQGIFLAALITYYGFLSLFPLLLLLSSVLGFLLVDQPGVQDYILNSAISQFPVIGTELSTPEGLQGSGAAAAIGGGIAIWGSLRASRATVHAMDVAWAIPRHRRPNPLLARVRSAALIGIAVIALLGATVISALGRSASALNVDLNGLTVLGLIAGSLAVNTIVFMMGMRVSTVRNLSYRDVLPGAIFAALGWQVLQAFGTSLVGGLATRSNDTYGVFALVLGLMGWIFLAACVVVFAVEINVVRIKRLYPRGLLAPLTEESGLTRADKRTYRQAAWATSFKESEQVTVTFAEDQPASAAGASSPAGALGDADQDDSGDHGQDEPEDVELEDVPGAEQAGDQATDDGAADAEQQRDQDADVLLARSQQSGQGADDEADDDEPENVKDHESSS